MHINVSQTLHNIHVFRDLLSVNVYSSCRFRFESGIWDHNRCTMQLLLKDFLALSCVCSFQRHLQAITRADRNLVCDAEIHFIPGHNIYQEMSRCIEESAVFVAVISENYCKSDHCQIEIAEARTTGKPILLIFKEHVAEDKMRIVIREIFRNFTRIKFVEEEGQYRIQPGWEQVCESIIQML